MINTRNSKRKGESVLTNEKLRITPIGAGNEVGRSCIIIEYKGKTIMLDCGIHPAHKGISALPYFDTLDPSSIDIILITHFHLDHAAALPYFLSKTNFKGRVFMTNATRSIYKLILQDYIRVSSIFTQENLYNETDLQRSMDKIEIIDFHQTLHVNGIKFWCYNAGHVLGAAMFMIEIANLKILYTGDYSRKDDRHLSAAEIPEIKPDVLIIESTYGTQKLQPIEERESHFTSLVHKIIERGGRCLIPVFALGRAQELLLILDEYWAKHPSLQSYPIYYASSLAKKCMAVYQTFIHMMNENIQKRFETSNPFKFNYIRFLKGIEDFQDIGPSVVFASPGMLQNGFSRQLFEEWCSYEKNGVIIPGYSVDGTLAKTIVFEPNNIQSMEGGLIPLKMSVNYVTFSAHADYSETSDFIRTLQPPHIILVHGDSNEIARLSKALELNNEDNKIQISTPKNCQTVELEFKTEKVAKTVGKLAVKNPTKDDIIEGLLVVKDYSMSLMEESELNSFTPLVSSKIFQSLKIPFNQQFSCLKILVSKIYEIKQIINSKDQPQIIQVYDMVKIKLYSSLKYIILEWTSSPTADIIADSLVAILMSVEDNSSKGTAKLISSSNVFPKSSDIEENKNKLKQIIQKQYGETFVNFEKDGSIRILIDEEIIKIDPKMMKVHCNNDRIKKNVENILDYARNILLPLSNERN